MAQIRNLSFLRSIPEFGAKLVEALQDITTRVSNVATQTNASPEAAQQAPPPQINALKIVAGGGVAHVQIVDNNSIYRGIQYHVQYATDPAFTSPITEHLGPSRDRRIPVGKRPLYWRAYSDYPTSSHSDPVYHGGNTPQSIAATGTDQPPIPAGQGSGTGYPGQISGHGPVQFRGAIAPKRG